jgi:hypothetical protein
MTTKKPATPPVAPPQRAVLSRIEVLGLILVFVLGFLFALPAMKATYMGAVLSGKCERDPKPASCMRPRSPTAIPGGFAWPK